MASDPSYVTRVFGLLVALAVLGPVLGIRAIGGGLTEGLILAFVLLVALLVVRWVFVDAKRRDLNAWGWAIGTALFNVLGLAVYLGARSMDDGR